MESNPKNNVKSSEENETEKNNKEENKIDMEGFQFFANICEDKLKVLLENFFSNKKYDKLQYVEEKIVMSSPEIQDADNDSSNENDTNSCVQNKVIRSNYDKIVLKLVDDVEQFMKPYVNDRYKIIVQGIIGENKKQGIHIASKSLWNVETDNYVSVKYVNDYIFVTVMVFLLYNE
ncbi:dynein light chain type 2, putative [Plasmodium reichenowi]|uniref:Dynein light chain type 2, putative n=1 Tax=Plasmodium reichenowi TaxID=5854 RepID=A0A060RZK4_PLARE|nr:dynein light chain type 2, putative [Plasmodium reichenowi]